MKLSKSEAKARYEGFKKMGGYLSFEDFLALNKIEITEKAAPVAKPAKKKEPVELKEVVGDSVNTDEGSQELKED